jgi:hypothetical protein
MCRHCSRDMTKQVYTDKSFHDAWLFPHGRVGYSDVTHEQVAEARAKCRFCPPYGPIAVESSAYGPAGQMGSQAESPEVATEPDL